MNLPLVVTVAGLVLLLIVAPVGAWAASQPPRAPATPPPPRVAPPRRAPTLFDDPHADLRAALLAASTLGERLDAAAALRSAVRQPPPADRYGRHHG